MFGRVDEKLEVGTRRGGLQTAIAVDLLSLCRPHGLSLKLALCELSFVEDDRLIPSWISTTLRSSSGTQLFAA